MVTARTQTRTIASPGLERPARQPGQRGGVWAVGEILAELLPHYGLPPHERRLPAPLALDENRAREHELLGC